MVPRAPVSRSAYPSRLSEGCGEATRIGRAPKGDGIAARTMGLHAAEPPELWSMSPECSPDRRWRRSNDARRRCSRRSWVQRVATACGFRKHACGRLEGIVPSAHKRALRLHAPDWMKRCAFAGVLLQIVSAGSGGDVRSWLGEGAAVVKLVCAFGFDSTGCVGGSGGLAVRDRKSTRLNSSHG